MHREAHALGIPSNCTMLYGHVETLRRPGGAPAGAARPPGRDGRIPDLHPARLSPRPQRAGRDAGPHRHRHDRLRRPEEHRRRPPGARQHPAREDALAHGDAVPLAGRAGASAATTSRAPWCSSASTTRPARETPMWLSYDEIVALIRGAGKDAGGARLALPDGADVRGLGARHGGADAAPQGPEGPTFHIEHRAQARGKGKRQLPVVAGAVEGPECDSAGSPTSTAIPVYGAIDRGAVRVPAELVTGTPAELNDLLVGGRARRQRDQRRRVRARTRSDLVLLPDLAISCDGPVRSVMLFSKAGVEPAGRRATVLRHRLVAHLGGAARAAVPRRLAGATRTSPRRAPRRAISSIWRSCRTTRCW